MMPCAICGATYRPPPARRGRGLRTQARWLMRHLTFVHAAPVPPLRARIHAATLRVIGVRS